MRPLAERRCFARLDLPRQSQDTNASVWSDAGSVAKEMERANMNTPLLIGGATTSRVHTAVKIDEHYNLGNTIHVLDASRSVTVVESLLGNKKQTFIDNLKIEYDTVRKNHASHVQNKSLLGIETARKNKLELSFNNDIISKPKNIGVQVLNDITVSEIIPYIDWTPFFLGT